MSTVLTALIRIYMLYRVRCIRSGSATDRLGPAGRRYLGVGLRTEARAGGGARHAQGRLRGLAALLAGVSHAGRAQSHRAPCLPQRGPPGARGLGGWELPWVLLHREDTQHMLLI